MAVKTYDVVLRQSRMITDDITAFLEKKRLKNVWNSEIYNNKNS